MTEREPVIDLALELIERYVDEPCYKRGHQYARDGRVKSFAIEGPYLTGRVHGADEYEVSISQEAESLTSRCSCPVEDDVCKHIVAAVLIASKRVKSLRDAVAVFEERRAKRDQERRAYFAKQSHEALVEFILDAADGSEALDRRIELRVKADTANGSIPELKKVLRSAIVPRGFIEYRSMPSYSARVDEVLDALEDLLAQGKASDVIALTEYAAPLLDKALSHVDDSGGELTWIAGRLGDMHYEAASMEPPDPVKLAKRLFDLELHTDTVDVFDQAALKYREILGKEGLAEYRRLAESEFDKVPMRGKQDQVSFDHGRFRISRIMETVVRADGDTNELVRVLERDLSSPYRYIGIAEELGSAGRYEEAIEWCKTGLDEFGDRDSRLIQCLADQYVKGGRLDDAIELMWERFVAAPGFERYVMFHRVISHSEDADRLRSKAIAVAEKAVDNKAQRVGDVVSAIWSAAESKGRFRSTDGSELVRILQWETRSKEAWRAACKYGCSFDQWVELAHVLSDDYPEIVLEILKADVERTVSATNNKAYADAVKIIKRIEKLYSSLERPGELEAYVQSLLAKFKPKKNFIALVRKNWRMDDNNAVTVPLRAR